MFFINSKQFIYNFTLRGKDRKRNSVANQLFSQFITKEKHTYGDISHVTLS